MKKTRFGLPGYLGVAAVWFATHAGGGFCTGRQGVEYYVRYGRSALWTPFFAMAICAVVYAVAWEICRVYKVYNYRAMADELYRPYNLLFSNIFEIGYLLTVILASAAGLAACGHLLDQLFGLSYIPGLLITAAGVLVIAQYGARALRNASSVMSVVIITLLIIVMVYLIPATAPNRAQVVATVNNPGWQWKAVLYAAFQLIGIAAYAPVSDVLQTRSDVIRAAFWGFVLNAAILWGITYTLLGCYPAVVKEALPLLSGIKQLGAGFAWLVTVYSLMLYAGNLSTVVSFSFGMIHRIEASSLGKSTLFSNVAVGRWVVGGVLLAICLGIGQFGLIPIVAKGYPLLGYFGIAGVLIPVLTLGLSKIKEASAKS